LGEKDFVGRYDEKNRIRAKFTTHRGRVIEIELIQYEAYLEGQWVPLVRYDTAHGYLHRDVMQADGSQKKTRIPHTSLDEALTQAMDEIRRQWRFYRRIWEERVE
jgi:rubrerythrin